MVKRYKRKPGDVKRFKSIQADEYKADIAKLRTLRNEADYTQRKLAEILGESQTYITNVERGHRRIDIYEAKRWEQVCLVRIAELKAAEAAKAAQTSRPAPPTPPTVSDGASTSQPAGMGLPLAADARTGESPAAAPDGSARELPEAPQAGTPPQCDGNAPGHEDGTPPDDGAASPEDPQRK